MLTSVCVYSQAEQTGSLHKKPQPFQAVEPTKYVPMVKQRGNAEDIQ